MLVVDAEGNEGRIKILALQSVQFQCNILGRHHAEKQDHATGKADYMYYYILHIFICGRLLPT